MKDKGERINFIPPPITIDPFIYAKVRTLVKDQPELSPLSFILLPFAPRR
jgi:hypothetical protein